MPRQLVAKVMLTAMAFILLLLVGFVFDLRNAQETQNLIVRLNDVVALRLLESSEFDTHVTRTIREIQTYVLADEADEYEEAVEALALAEQNLVALRAVDDLEESLGSSAIVYRELNNRRTQLLQQLDITLASVEGLSQSDTATITQAFAEFEEIEHEIEQLSIESRQALDTERAEAAVLAAASVRQNYLVIVINILVAVLFCIIAVVFLNRAIVQPISVLAVAAMAFARGNRTELVPVSSNDEVGVLQRSFNTLISTVQQQTQELRTQATVAEEIRRQARQAQRLADDLAERNRQIAAQAASLQNEISERQVIESALIQARDEAQTASRAKSAFLATMSHELRTPLSAILGYGQLMQHMIQQREYSQLQTDLNSVQRAGDHLLALISDILDISQIEANKLNLAYTSFDVVELVQETAKTVQPLVARGNNTLTVVCQPGIGTIYTDMTRIRQVLLNLLSNAAKFTENGQITLSVARLEQSRLPYLRIMVADTGIGILESQLPQLFHVFSQLDDSYSRKSGGTGLGLALSQKLANALGGQITVESSFGAGSTFTLELPLYVDETEEPLQPIGNDTISLALAQPAPETAHDTDQLLVLGSVDTLQFTAENATHTAVVAH